MSAVDVAPSNPNAREHVLHEAARRPAAWLGAALALLASCSSSGGDAAGAAADAGAGAGGLGGGAGDPAALTVTTDGPSRADGEVGGPFAPQTQRYTLTNVGAERLAWEARSAAAWARLFPTEGELEPGDSAQVELLIDAATAGDLAPGRHVARLEFAVAGASSASWVAAFELDVVDPAGTLLVDAALPQQFRGDEGGPFSPPVQALGLSNGGEASLSWSVATDQPWLHLGGSGGQLAGGVEASLAVSLDSELVATMLPGLHEAYLDFRNLTDGRGDCTRRVLLSITAGVGTLAVDPEAPQVLVGAPGGPFTPDGSVFVLANTGGQPLSWRVAEDCDWLTVAGADHGGLVPGGSTSVRLEPLAEVAETLPLGEHVAEVRFLDESSGASLVRTCTLSVRERDGGLVFEPDAEFRPVGRLGGPFTPVKSTRTLVNRGSRAVEWSAAIEGEWLELRGPQAGTLAPGESVDVQLSYLPGVANFLPAGEHLGGLHVAVDGVDDGPLVRASLAVAELPDAGDPEDEVTIVPGDGWDAPTQQPPPTGSGPGSAAVAFGRWNAVPYQDVTGRFNVGVVAFHAGGIDRVEIAAENGPWHRLERMRYNARTRTVEYWATLRPELFATQGLVQLRAIAYPKLGTPRVLEPLFLYVGRPEDVHTEQRWVSPNGDDSGGDGSAAQPFRTIARAAESIHTAQGDVDGGEILLRAGSYAFGPVGTALNGGQRWLTVRGAPGVPRSQVRLVSSGAPGLWAHLVHLRGLTIEARLYAASGNGDSIWVESCTLVGEGQSADVGTESAWFVNGWAKRYATNVIVRDDAWGIENGTLLRNVQCFRIGSDVFGGSLAIVNCSVDDVDRGGQTAWHPDVYDLGGGNDVRDNHIVYGLKATDCAAQGIHTKNLAKANVAFVNVLIEGMGYSSQWEEVASDHLLLWNCIFDGQSFHWRTPSSELDNVSVRGCVFKKMDVVSPGSIQDLWFESTHFVDTSSYGALAVGVDWSGGDPGFVNAAADDYRLLPDSPLKSRLDPVVPVDLAGSWRHDPASIGVYE